MNFIKFIAAAHRLQGQSWEHFYSAGSSVWPSAPSPPIPSRSKTKHQIHMLTMPKAQTSGRIWYHPCTTRIHTVVDTCHALFCVHTLPVASRWLVQNQLRLRWLKNSESRPPAPLPSPGMDPSSHTSELPLCGCINIHKHQCNFDTQEINCIFTQSYYFL